ncbi:MAG TPA: thioester-forming surface-anchored protein, partial [Lachnospiraceae bacterium]
MKRMKRMKKMLALFLTAILVFGIGRSNAESVFADNEKFVGWTNGKSEDIYVSPEGQHIGDINAAEVAYCFNFMSATPPSSTEGPLPTYTKEKGTQENFANHAIGENLSPQELYNKVLDVMYNGYPNNGANLIADYNLDPARLRTITQYAIWNFTDRHGTSEHLKSLEEQIAQLQGQEKEVFDILIGEKEGNSKRPENSTLYIYVNTLDVPSNNQIRPQYQNLLSSKFVDDEGREIKVEPKFSIYAQKKWEGGNPTKKTTVEFVLKKGQEEKERRTLTTEENQELSDIVKWEDLTGNRADYTVEEVSSPEGYTISPQISGKGTASDPRILTNKKEEEAKLLTSITITKTWKDEPNQDKRPKELYFGLFRSVDGQAEELVTNDMAYGIKMNPRKWEDRPQIWSNFFAQLVNDQGQKITYSVKEVDSKGAILDMPNYESTQEMNSSVSMGNEKRVYTITNTYKPTATEVTFSKVEVNKSEELAGADLTVVEGESAEGQTVATDAKDGSKLEWKSGNETKKFSLKEGTYTMIERQAPEGYEIAEAITFRVTAKGEVEVKEGN